MVPRTGSCLWVSRRPEWSHRESLGPLGVAPTEVVNASRGNNTYGTITIAQRPPTSMNGASGIREFSLPTGDSASTVKIRERTMITPVVPARVVAIAMESSHVDIPNQPTTSPRGTASLTSPIPIDGGDNTAGMRERTPIATAPSAAAVTRSGATPAIRAMSSRVVVTTVVTPTAELGRRWTAISVCARAVPMNTSPSGMSASRDRPKHIPNNPHPRAGAPCRTFAREPRGWRPTPRHPVANMPPPCYRNEPVGVGRGEHPPTNHTHRDGDDDEKHGVDGHARTVARTTQPSVRITRACG